MFTLTFAEKTMKEINPRDTTRAYAFEAWMDAPMPMVTFVKTLDVSRIVRLSRKGGFRHVLSCLLCRKAVHDDSHRDMYTGFNMLMCWCIGKAASRIKEFYLLPVGRKLMQYESIAVNTIVLNRDGEVSSCDIPFSEDLETFSADYLRLTRNVAETCKNHDITGSMVIGTSCMAFADIDMAVGMYSGVYNNPFLIWGRYRKGLFRTRLTVSFQFHHTQMDGAHAARFLDNLQHEIRHLSV